MTSNDKQYSIRRALFEAQRQTHRLNNTLNDVCYAIHIEVREFTNDKLMVLVDRSADQISVSLHLVSAVQEDGTLVAGTKLHALAMLTPSHVGVGFYEALSDTYVRTSEVADLMMRRLETAVVGNILNVYARADVTEQIS